MKLKIVSYLILLYSISGNVYGQWVVVGSMPNHYGCGGLYQLSPTMHITSADTNFYYYNSPRCSPSSGPAFEIYNSQNNLNWSSIMSGGGGQAGASLNTIFFVTTQIGYASVYQMSPIQGYKTLNSGLTWSPLVNAIPSYNLYFTNPDSGFAITYDGTLYKVVNDTFHLVAPINIAPCFNPDLHITHNENCFALGMDSATGYKYHTVFRSLNGGAIWTVSLRDTSRIFYDICFISDSIGYLSSDTGLYKTYDAGNSWSLLITPFSKCTYISAVNNTFLYVIGLNEVYKSIDGGITWTIQLLSGNHFVKKFKMLNDSIGIIHALNTITYQHEILKTNNGGVAGINTVGIAPSNSLTISPNPSDGKFEIALPEEVTDKIKIEIFSVSGKLTEDYSMENLLNKVTLDLKVQSSGLYLIHLQSGDFNYYGKVLIR